jgi:hypothetical protein
MPNDHVRITAPLFERFISRLLYYPTFYPTLPALIRRLQIQTQRMAPLSLVSPPAVSLKAAASTQDIGVHAAVECRDRPHDRVPQPNDSATLDTGIYYGVCRD